MPKKNYPQMNIQTQMYFRLHNWIFYSIKATSRLSKLSGSSTPRKKIVLLTGGLFINIQSQIFEYSNIIHLDKLNKYEYE